jgi:hypothetical protein
MKNLIKSLFIVCCLTISGTAFASDKSDVNSGKYKYTCTFDRTNGIKTEYDKKKFIMSDDDYEVLEKFDIWFEGEKNGYQKGWSYIRLECKK